MLSCSEPGSPEQRKRGSTRPVPSRVFRGETVGFSLRIEGNHGKESAHSRLSTLILLIYGLVLTSDWLGERARWRVA
jgi:hypothetical protein